MTLREQWQYKNTVKFSDPNPIVITGSAPGEKTKRAK
jgi:hypothetical protein